VEGTRERRRVGAWAVLATVGLALASCDDALGPRTPLGELEDREALWARRRPDAYVFTILRSCECLPEATGPVRVTVDGPAVVARVYEDTGRPVAAALVEVFPSVEGLFDIAREALMLGHHLAVTYDDRSGVPLEVWVEPDVDVGDDEFGYRVTVPPTEPAHLR